MKSFLVPKDVFFLTTFPISSRSRKVVRRYIQVTLLTNLLSRHMLVSNKLRTNQMIFHFSKEDGTNTKVVGLNPIMMAGWGICFTRPVALLVTESKRNQSRERTGPVSIPMSQHVIVCPQGKEKSN